MIRVFLFLLVVLVLAAGLHWLADRPGTITVEWLGYIIETSVFRGLLIMAAAVALVMLAWSGLREMWRSPAAVGHYLARRRQKRGLDALTGGIIAVGAGDRTLAVRYASQARKTLPHEPLTHLLRAQAAQIGGDRATARRIFEAMLASPDTETLGLRGLYLEAEREGAREAARQYAERALKRNPKLDWPVDALFDLQCRAGDWQGALETLDIARRQNLIEKPLAARRRAVLLTAQAQVLEDEDADKACERAREAHRLAPDLIPAAAIAGRVLASRGDTPRAARVILKTWRVAPHPDLAAAYAYARPGDSPRDRLVRVRHLARLTPGHPEAQIAVAISAIEAREWDEARRVLQPLLDTPEKQTQRVCTLMARIEGEQHADTGRVREWLARAANAPRDPAWVADGVVAERWNPLSPVTGVLDAMRWQVPGVAAAEPSSSLAARMEVLAGLGPATHTHSDAPATDAGTRPVPAPAIAASSPVDEPEKRTLPPVRAQEDAAPVASPPPRDAPAGAPPSAPYGTRIVESDVPYRQRPAPATEAARPERTKPETKIFVPPRAPDDPGLGPDTDDLSPLAYPITGAKA
jgi:HemY protein